MDSVAIKDRFVEAIPDQRLAEVARAVLEGGRLDGDAEEIARAALAACSAISRSMADVQSEVIASLVCVGVKARAVGDLVEQAALQFHSATISIPRADLGIALPELAKLGFYPSIEMTKARVACLRRTAKQLQLVRFDQATTRIILQFESDPPSLLPRPLRPGLADLGEVSLPGPLAPFYALVRPFRLVKERVSGVRSPHHEIDFLGTPAGLIAPILECLDLVEGDVLLDLGCGDGRVLSVAAEQFGCRAIGVEHNGDLVARARAMVAKSPAAERIDIRHASADTADLSEASVVFMFLPLGLLPDLVPSVKRRMNGAARLVMHEQSRPGKRFVEDKAIPVFTADGITVVRVQNGGVQENG